MPSIIKSLYEARTNRVTIGTPAYSWKEFSWESHWHIQRSSHFRIIKCRLRCNITCMVQIGTTGATHIKYITSIKNKSCIVSICTNVNIHWYHRAFKCSFMKKYVRRTWALHGIDGWYLGLTLEHYRCYRVYATQTGGKEYLMQWNFYQET